MKKFKVGEYVRIVSSDTIGRVACIDSGGVHVYTGKLINYLFMECLFDELEHLNIKFKHFNIVLKSDGEREVWDSMRKIRGFGRVHLICMEEQHDIFIGYKIPHRRILSTHVQTVEQAEDWLELQHARTLVESKEAMK